MGKKRFYKWKSLGRQQGFHPFKRSRRKKKKINAKSVWAWHNKREWQCNSDLCFLHVRTSLKAAWQSSATVISKSPSICNMSRGNEHGIPLNFRQKMLPVYLKAAWWIWVNIYQYPQKSEMRCRSFSVSLDVALALSSTRMEYRDWRCVFRQPQAIPDWIKWLFWSF